MKHNLFKLAVVLLLASAAFAQINNGGGSGSGSGTVLANNGTAGANAFYSAAGGSTTVSPDANLVDNGSTFLAALGLQFTGAQGAATTISTSAANANLILAPNGTGVVVVPAGTASANGVTFSGLTSGLSATAGNVFVNFGNSSSTFHGVNGATALWNIASGAGGNNGPGLEAPAANTGLALAGNLTTNTNFENVRIGSISGTSLTGTTATTQVAATFGMGATTADGQIKFAPTSGSTNFIAVQIAPQLNQTGGANGTMTDLFISPTTTAVVGTHNFLDIGTGGSGGSFTVTSTGNVKPLLYGSITNCSATGTAANPSVASCTAAPTGAFSCATASVGNCQVNTTAVTANSNIILQQTANTAVGTRLGVTCNVTSSVVVPLVTSQTAATSFSFAVTTPVTNPDCFYYWIIN